MKPARFSHIAIALFLFAGFLYACGGASEEAVPNSGGLSNESGDTGGGTAAFTTQMQKLLAPDADINDAFGYTVAIDGDYAIAGSPYEGPGVYGSGAAYIFHRDPATDRWDSGTKIIAPDAEADDQFGKSVSISGDYAIVGSNTSSGYIFHRTGTNSWDSGVRLTVSDVDGNTGLSSDVSISGDYAVVGSAGDDGNTGDFNDNRGAAYVFNRTGTNSWNNVAKLTAADAATSDFLGNSVSIDGGYVVVGAVGADRDGGNRSLGAAYIFQRTGTNSWDDGTKIVAFDASPSIGFAATVSISGDYVIAGAPGAIMGAGAAYIFHRTDTNMWDSGTKIVAPDGEAQDAFGQYSISISGNYAIVGASYENTMGDGAGATYVFHRDPDTDSWDGGTKILASDGQATDYFGISVAISGDHAIVGASSNSEAASNAGAVYIFE